MESIEGMKPFREMRLEAALKDAKGWLYALTEMIVTEDKYEIVYNAVRHDMERIDKILEEAPND